MTVYRFCCIIIDILNEKESCKEKHVRGTEQTKTRSCIQIKEITVSHQRKPKKNYFSNLNIKDIVDNNLFWKTVKPSLSKPSSLF